MKGYVRFYEEGKTIHEFGTRTCACVCVCVFCIVYVYYAQGRVKLRERDAEITIVARAIGMSNYLLDDRDRELLSRRIRASRQKLLCRLRA